MTRLNERGIAPLQPDFRFRNHGSVSILETVSAAAMEWSEEHIGADAMRFGGGIIVEPPYVDNLVAGIRDEGLTVEAA